MLGAEHFAHYVWDLWVKHGRKGVAKQSGFGWELRMTRRYRFSLIAALLTSSYFVWFCLFSNSFENSIGRNVMGATLIIISLMSLFGTFAAFVERVRISILGIERTTLFSKKTIEWTSISGLSLPNAGEKILVLGQNGSRLSISLYMDGLATFLDLSLQYMPIPVSFYTSSGVPVPQQNG
jgi:hypothetical protein